MSQEEKKPRIGGISQQRGKYSTIGGGKSQEQTLERSDVQEGERPGSETPGRSNVPTPERLGTETLGSSGVQGEERSSVETSKRLDTQAPERTGKRDRERHTIYLPPDLSQWVKIRAVTTKREISELATEALERYRSEIEGNEKNV